MFLFIKHFFLFSKLFSKSYQFLFIFKSRSNVKVMIYFGNLKNSSNKVYTSKKYQSSRSISSKFIINLNICIIIILNSLPTIVSSADNPCKQFGSRSGLTICRAWSGSRLFGTLMLFLKDFFSKKSTLKKISRRKKSMQNYPVGRVN